MIEAGAIFIDAGLISFELSIEEMNEISNLKSENHRIVTREKMANKEPPMGNCVPYWD